LRFDSWVKAGRAWEASNHAAAEPSSVTCREPLIPKNKENDI
jgi:hypothetical protein